MRKPNDLVKFRLGDDPDMPKALAEVRIALKHVGPKQSRAWGFEFKRIEAEAETNGWKSASGGVDWSNPEVVQRLTEVSLSALATCEAKLEGLPYAVEDHLAEIDRLGIAEQLIAFCNQAQSLEESEVFLPSPRNDSSGGPAAS